MIEYSNVSGRLVWFGPNNIESKRKRVFNRIDDDVMTSWIEINENAKRLSPIDK